MDRTFRFLRALVLTLAAVLVLALMGATPALAQASRFSAEITKIDIVERRVTFKASMGQQTMRVAPDVALEALAPGDKVLLTFGQDGVESIITSIKVMRRNTTSWRGAELAAPEGHQRGEKLT